MKKYLITVLLILPLIFQSVQCPAAEISISGNKVTVDGAVESGTLIVTYFNGATLVGVRTYRGTGTIEADISAAPENATSFKAFYWDMRNILPLCGMVEMDDKNTDETGNEIMIKIGGKEFRATLYDNETAAAFKELLPLTLDMSELNGNEKYYYLPDSLPAKAEKVGTIQAGDIMLYGSSCVVLFYETFNTSYSYTKIGHIDDVAGLTSALGRGGVTVTFE